MDSRVHFEESMRSQNSEHRTESIHSNETSETLNRSVRKIKRATTLDLDEFHGQFRKLKTDHENEVKINNEDRKTLKDNIDKKVIELQQDINRKVPMTKYQNDRESLYGRLHRSDRKATAELSQVRDQANEALNVSLVVGIGVIATALFGLTIGVIKGIVGRGRKKKEQQRLHDLESMVAVLGKERLHTRDWNVES